MFELNGKRISFEDIQDLGSGEARKVICKEKSVRIFNHSVVNSKCKITCYRQTEEWASNIAAIAFFYFGSLYCSGSEAERYTRIYTALADGNTEASDE